MPTTACEHLRQYIAKPGDANYFFTISATDPVFDGFRGVNLGKY